MADNQIFLNAYNTVFDANDNIKACGRQACIKLIDIANEIEPEVSHGNTSNGMINTYLLNKLKNKIKEAI